MYHYIQIFIIGSYCTKVIPHDMFTQSMLSSYLFQDLGKKANVINDVVGKEVSGSFDFDGKALMNFQDEITHATDGTFKASIEIIPLVRGKGSACMIINDHSFEKDTLVLSNMPTKDSLADDGHVSFLIRRCILNSLHHILTDFICHYHFAVWR